MNGLAAPPALRSAIPAAVTAISAVDAAVAKVLALPPPHVQSPLMDLCAKLADIVGVAPPKSADDLMAFFGEAAKKLGTTAPTQSELQAYLSQAALMLGVDLNAKPAQQDLDELAARSNAEKWSTVVRPAVAVSLRSVSTFAATFDADYLQLTAVCAKLAGGDSSALPAFKALIGKWQAQTTEAASGAAAGVTGVQQLQGELEANARAIAEDKTAAVTAAAAANAAIPGLQQQVSDVQAKIDAANIALEAAGLLGEVIRIEIQRLGGQLSLFSGQLEDAERKLASGQAAVDAANQVAQVADAYTQSTAGITTALQSLSDGWAAMNGNFKNLIEAEAITDLNAFTSAQLAAAKADWDNLALQANGIGRG